MITKNGGAIAWNLISWDRLLGKMHRPDGPLNPKKFNDFLAPHVPMQLVSPEASRLCFAWGAG
jgi:hypothetical protein